MLDALSVRLMLCIDPETVKSLKIRHRLEYIWYGIVGLDEFMFLSFSSLLRNQIYDNKAPGICLLLPFCFRYVQLGCEK